MLPPVLHIQLGIMNKTVEVLDLVVERRETPQGWSLNSKSPAKTHLAECLSLMGIMRQNLYSDEITGGSGRTLMKRMDQLCEQFFCTNAGDWLPVVYSIPGVMNLKNGLEESNVILFRVEPQHPTPPRVIYSIRRWVIFIISPIQKGAIDTLIDIAV